MSRQVRVLLVDRPDAMAARPVERHGSRSTQPLVALLHHRKELRDVYAPADIIDQAVRDGV